MILTRAVLRFLYRDPKWHEAIRVVHTLVDRYIDDAFRQQAHKDLEKVKNSPSTGAERDRYILLHEMAKETQNKEDLRSQILTVFMPGRDSTGYALAMFSMFLHKGVTFTKGYAASCSATSSSR